MVFSKTVARSIRERGLGNCSSEVMWFEMNWVYQFKQALHLHPSSCAMRSRVAFAQTLRYSVGWKSYQVGHGYEPAPIVTIVYDDKGNASVDGD